MEAIAPTSGADTNPDRVPDMKPDVATLVPDDEIVLRYRDAIREKYDNKYHNYIQNGLIMPTDGYVIAIKHPHNPLATGNRLRHGFLEVGREHISTEYNDGCAIKVTNWN